jgi:cobaltochelatase CobN
VARADRVHLLSTTPGTVDDGSEAIDLVQTPGDIVFLSAADTELACLVAGRSRLDAAFPAVRLANIMRLGHNLSVDLYVDSVIRGAKIVIVRLLGGRSYWPYGVDEVEAACRKAGIAVAFLPGDDQPDPELASRSSVAAEDCHRLWQFLVQGGIDNAHNCLAFAASLIGATAEWREPRPLMRAGYYLPGIATPDLAAISTTWTVGAPVAAVVFYRALVQAGNLAPIDALCSGLRAAGLNPLPLYVTSLKDPPAAAIVEEALAETSPDVILNATGFSVSTPGVKRRSTPFDGADCPVLQVVFAGNDQKSWEASCHGLSPRDIAMNVALPEVDGRILSRAVSFKGSKWRDSATECDIVAYEPVADRIDFTCNLAAAWATLRRKSAAERRIAIVLANYPNRDGRLGNGVGLDTPAATVGTLTALSRAGYGVAHIPTNGDALIAQLIAGPTNDWRKIDGRSQRENISLSDYQSFFSALPVVLQKKITDRWGTPEADLFYRPGKLDCGHFVVPVLRLGNVAVCIQPARGYNVDPRASYHDPDLPPTHAYLAFHAWVRHSFCADAVVHMGKHGNLEWLPGKALALSSACFPEAALGPVPNVYPFIVNDPGEGTQAKRRAGAVIIDHLTPPLTRAESYGPLRDLECLVDEYFDASGLDPRRLKVLATDILSLCRTTGLDADCGINPSDAEPVALGKLDSYLCELKEMQIRDGLHIFGEAPVGRLLTDLLVALARVPRGTGKGHNASLIRALAEDLELGFDPLNCDMGAPWSGQRPEALEPFGVENNAGGLSPLMGEEEGDRTQHNNSLTLPARSGAPHQHGLHTTLSNKGRGLVWRTTGDTLERLEGLAAALVFNTCEADKAWARTTAVLGWIHGTLRPAVTACGAAEMAGLLTALNGRFVEPGPSGAPTRGRPDVLPTGRNFYSVDTRTIPTPAAWTLGWKSAGLLVERHIQEHGEWPRAMAISAWGTSNMRTGGDDIAQALALIGAQPTWDTASRRVTGFEVLPAEVLGRPRVDVTLRVSGFFRDAFPNLIDLFDSAVRAVAAREEPTSTNPLGAQVRADTATFEIEGMTAEEARRRAEFRVFGSKPGSYGAGLQALIDEKGWDSGADLARAYVAWGGYAYGQGTGGEAAHNLFEHRLGGIQAVVQNQDNREHDLLDSDDYYQFEGGLTAAITSLSGQHPAVYHPDHSRPENPRIRTLEEEIARVVRARAANPKWISGVMRHGYKGAFEMAATVDYLFAFAATTAAVRDHHFDALFEAYLGDATVRDFMERSNPAALKEMANRFEEAVARGLWRPRSNRAGGMLRELATSIAKPV